MPQSHLEVIGIAGGSGKTSVGHLLAQALTSESRTAVVGALGVGFPMTLGEGDPDAGQAGWADPDVLRRTLAGLRAQGAETVALAIPRQDLRQGRAAGLGLDQAVLTELSEASDQDAGAVDDLLRSPGLGWAVLPADDPAAARIVPGAGTSLALYGLGPRPPDGRRPDLWVGLTEFTQLPRGLRLAVITSGVGGDQTGEVEVPLLGACNAANLLAALAVLRTRGLSLRTALHALAKVRGVPGRLEGFGRDGAPLVVVDSACSPEGLSRTLTQLRPHCRGRLILVCGCAGATDPGLRPRLGAVAEAGSDLVILTDDNPGDVDGDAILAEIRAGMVHPERVRVERRRGIAIRIALTLAGRDDCVLIAGKGQATIQDLGAVKQRFSDRAEAVQALLEWTGGGR